MTVAALFKFIHRSPMRPFEISLTDGRTFHVDNYDYIMRTPDNRFVTICPSIGSSVRIPAHLLAGVRRPR